MCVGRFAECIEIVVFDIMSRDSECFKIPEEINASTIEARTRYDLISRL